MRSTLDALHSFARVRALADQIGTATDDSVLVAFAPADAAAGPVR